MKKITYCLALLLSSIVYSQSNIDLSLKDLKDTDPKNQLSQYFKNTIPKKNLRDLKYRNGYNSITMSFSINKENKPYNITLNTFASFDIKEEVIKAFQKYPLKKLNLDTISKNRVYYLQIISKKGVRNIFNCSNKILHKTLPTSSSCSDLAYYEDIQKCIKQKIKVHFLENVNFAAIKRFKTDQKFNIEMDFIVDENGILKLEKLKSSRIFREEIEAAVATFPVFEIPATSNGKKTYWKYNIHLQFDKENIPSIKKDINYDSIFPKEATNDFALFLKKNITNDALKKANLNRINNTISLSFELDKNNSPFNISTTARSNSLDSLIITNFKKYPIYKLNLPAKNPFNYYFTQVVKYKDSITYFETNNLVGFERVAIHPNCVNSKSILSLRTCLSKEIQKHFSSNFNKKLPKTLNLNPGAIRVVINFKITKKGEVSHIHVTAPHKKIEEEAIRVLNLLPKIMPAIQNNKAVGINFRIPFSLLVKR